MEFFIRPHTFRESRLCDCELKVSFCLPKSRKGEVCASSDVKTSLREIIPRTKKNEKGQSFFDFPLQAIGIAYQTARFTRSRSVAFNCLVRHSSGWFVILLLGLIGAAQGLQVLGERNVLVDLPVRDPSSPNVLLIVLDTVRAESLSLYGYQKRTIPNLEDMAKGGVSFESALSTSPWTLPSHASMFTGLYLSNPG